jgi:hypothetical protein
MTDMAKRIAVTGNDELRHRAAFCTKTSAGLLQIAAIAGE